MVSQLLGATVLVVAVLGLGTGATVLVRRRLDLDPATTAGLVPLLGVTLVGAATLVAGHLALLHPALPLVLAALGLLAPAAARQDTRAIASELRAGARRAWAAYPVLLAAMVVALLLAFTAGVAPPYRTDEVEYHWPAPLAWAENGGWDASPYRHVNAFPFMEVVYTSAAVLGSYVGAHWVHTLTMVGMGLCAAGVAATLGSRLGVPVAAATMVSPVVWLQSFTAYNDVAAAAFSVAAVAVLLSGRWTRSALGLSCVLLASAVSIKPTSVAAVGVVALIAALAAWWQVGPDPPSLRRAVRSWMPLAATAVLTTAFWTVRQWLYTGHWLDPAMTVEPDAYARTMLPDAADRVVWPFLPFVAGLLGSAEPWGGRTSLVVQVLLLPALAYVLWRRGTVLRRFALLALPAYVHWMVLGVLIVRTRFHIMTWVLLTVAVAVAADDLLQSRPAWQRALRLVWLGLVLLGLLDVLRQTVGAIGLIG